MSDATQAGYVICFDPRDPEQSVGDPSTWKPTDNIALIAAHWQPIPARPPGFWDRVKVNADYCDEMVSLT